MQTNNHKPTHEMTDEELANLPANYPGILIIPGRRFYGTAYGPIPVGHGYPYGGDVLLCVWRFEKTPGTWHATIRFRHNVSEDSRPEDDKKSWSVVTFSCPDEDIEKIALRITDLICNARTAFFKTVAEPLNWIVVNGDYVAMGKALEEASPNWFHRTVHDKKPSA